ncbi:MAG: diguanylate cyclase [Acidaminococcaceae bacterium]|nr:diguanylate cyclase [Acidaminococcaceae bacterium]
MKDGPIKLLTKKWQLLLAFFVTIFLFFSGLAVLSQQDDVSADRRSLAKEQEIFAASQKKVIENEMVEAVQHLLYLEASPVFKAYLLKEAPAERLEEEWRLFAGKIRKYHHIRYMDVSGREIVRVNFKDGRAEAVRESELQAKNEKKCFAEAIRLSKRMIYRSVFDLNVENGRIEEPLKPVIRFAMPVFGKEDEISGVLVISYRGSIVIDGINGLMRQTNYLKLVNDEGYWLAGSGSGSDWAFMYPDKSRDTFAALFPEEWQTVKKEEEGQLSTPAGLFTFSRIRPAFMVQESLKNGEDKDIILKGADEGWFLISHVPAGAVDSVGSESPFAIALKRFLRQPANLLAISLVAAFFSAVIVLYLEENNKIRALATYDLMTGCFNRRTGIELIRKAIAGAERSQKPVSMLLFDLDHFKRVNDTWGHIVGDNVLKCVAKTAMNAVRGGDSVIRSGGEEFVVLLPDTGAAEAVKVADRLRSELEAYQHPQVGKVTASFGAAQKKAGESQLQWYKRVDDALYRAKASGRNRVYCAEENYAGSPVANVQLKWSKDWESGNELIDEQHKEIIRLGNTVIFKAYSGAEKEEAALLLEKLLNYVKSHFDHEEKILREAGYDGIDEHSANHEIILEEAHAMREGYLQGSVKPSAFFAFMVDTMILGHMIDEDKKFYEFLGAKALDDYKSTERLGFIE